MSQRTRMLLKQIAPLIPGDWNRAEMLKFEETFHTIVGEAIEQYGREAADKRERDLIQGLHQFEGWQEEIDKTMLLFSKNPLERITLHLGDRLRMFLNGACARNV